MSGSPGPVRLYGNWLRPIRMSLRGVSIPVATLAAAAYLSGLILAQSNPGAGAAVVAGCVLLTVLAAARIGGLSVAEWTGAAARWRWARLTGRNRTHALTGPRTDQWVAPGPLAGTRLVDVHPRGGQAYGAVHDPRTRRVAVSLLVAATAGDLGEPGDQDVAVARWERWLESLGHHPQIVHVQVSTETAPSPGTALRQRVRDRLHAQGPRDCRDLMERLGRELPSGAVQVQTRVTITLDLRAWDSQVSRRGRRRGLGDYLPLIDRTITALAAGLDGCGVVVEAAMSPQQVAAAVRVAVDPASAGAVELADLLSRADAVDWAHAGPVRAVEDLDVYRHESAVSASFVWAQAPRHLVASTVLAPLIAPSRFRRRVTCTYLASPAGRAMDAATAQVRRRRLARAVAQLPVIGRAGTAQDDRDAAAADQASAEVAAGAGWVAQTITATVTVTDPDDLPAAVAELHQDAGAAQLRLRRLIGLQAAGFHVGLPTGQSLTDLARRWYR